MYIIQVSFKNSGLGLRHNSMYLVSTEDEIVEKVRSRKKNIDCEIYTGQPREIQDDMIAHWARKGLYEGDELEAIRQSVYNNNYVLLFPVFKLCRIRPDGNLEKFLEATLINDKVYILEEANKKGEFIRISRL